MVTASSKLRVWWLLPYDDPKTGKHYDFSWKASINSRTFDRTSCPYLSGKRVWPGFNDLCTKAPILAKEWDYKKNAPLTPDMVPTGSCKKVWWLFPYDDPRTGKHYDFSWQATVNERANNGTGCPFLVGLKVYPGFNDLLSLDPALAKQWDYKKNFPLTPDMVTVSTNRLVWWLLPFDDPNTGIHYDFSWKAAVANRHSGASCPFLAGEKVWPGYNDLAFRYPELAEQWDYEKNAPLTPTMVSPGSQRRVWWLFPYDDPNTGKHYDFSWNASVACRVRYGPGCPFLSGQRVWTGFNDLATTHPQLAAQWDYERNAPITPKTIGYGSIVHAAWTRSYDDPITGKHFDFKWTSVIKNRNADASDCPYLQGISVWSGFNDLQTCFPEIAKEWHPTKNIKPPSKVFKYTTKVAVWKCSYCGYEYIKSVRSRTALGISCSMCKKY